MIRLNLTILAAFMAIQTPLFAGQANTQAEKTPGTLSIDRISVEPDQDERPASLRWSPDGSRVAWMQLIRLPAKSRDKSPQMEIWTFAESPGNGTGSLPDAAAKSQSESRAVQLVSAARVTASLRGTDTPVRSTGDDDDGNNPYLLRDFRWSTDHTSLLLISGRSISWLDVASGKSRILTSVNDDTPHSEKPVIEDAELSPDGHTVTYIRNHHLWTVGVAAGSPRSLLPKTNTALPQGELDWPYRNEFHLKRGYWWSPDSAQIAYLQLDDRAVSRYTLHSSDGDAKEIVYPKPGGELPVAHVFVRRVVGNSTPLGINLGQTKGFYLPRVAWLPDGRHLAIERLDRYQRTLDLFIADASTGEAHQVLTEKDQYWINISDELYFLKDGKRFLWSSERSGFRHLYLYDFQGKELAQVTRGNWAITSLNAVDETSGCIYFTATEKSPLERQLYRVNLDGSRMARITTQPGTHEVYFTSNAANFVDSYSSHTVPPRLVGLAVASGLTADASNPYTSSGVSEKTTEARSIPRENGQSITHHDEPAIAHPDSSATPAAIPASADDSAPLPVEFLDIKLHLGAQTHAFIIKPPNFDPAKKYPVIVYLAGGPGEQLVRDAWGGATGLWMQLMARKGYILFGLDNQGTAGRGHSFEEPIHLRLGAQELTDQRDGLLYLESLPYVDMARLGACGWGYGGFLVVHAMLDRPVAFKVGFAGAPIIDWHTYDAIFAERYLEDPVKHADGWDASMAIENDSPHFFKGSLMIAQGTEDEFVHIENTLILQDRLLDAGKSADLLLFSDRGHKIVDRPSRFVLFTRMTDFFVKNL